MEQYDEALARRVWQRVWGEGETLGNLLAAETALAETYRILARRLPGQAGVFRQLLAEAGRHIRCLRGIGYLTTGTYPPELPLKPRQETTEGLLRKCYGQTINAAAEYARRSEEQEYGPVFAQLAREKQQHTTRLLELLGSLPGGGAATSN